MRPFLRVLVVDDARGMRFRIRRLLEEELGAVVVGEAGSGEQALSALAETDWDVLILDVKMPGRNGLDLLPDIFVARPACRVVVMSSLPAHPYARAALRAGAASFVQKEHAPSELIPAIHSALATPACRGKPDASDSITPT